MSGFFLNQKLSFFAFLLWQNWDLFLPIGEGRTQTRYILFLPCGWPHSVTLQGLCLPSHSCLCLLHLFGADYIMGSCLVFPDWPEWHLRGYLYLPSSPSPLTAFDHSPWAWVTRMALVAADRAACGAPSSPGAVWLLLPAPCCWWSANAFILGWLKVAALT